MPRFRKIIIFLVVVGSVFAWAQFSAVSASNLIQGTGQSVPTVTGTPGGIIVTVTNEEPQVNLRAGPNTIYPKVGVLVAGQTVVAKGRSPGGEWIQVAYAGAPSGVAWISTKYLSIPPGYLPNAAVPPTPGPQLTQTIDATLASQLIVTAVPTRLPTFTQPAPLVVPTLPAQGAMMGSGGIPMGMVIVSLAALGIFLGLISLIRGR
jgi:hypothetical protein